MIPPLIKTARHSNQHGFSLIELMVVGGLVAALFTVTAMVYRTVSNQQGKSLTFVPVRLGKAITNSFFPDAAQRNAFGGTLEMPASIDVMSAPHYGTEFEVGVMKEKLSEDTTKSSAVFILPRGHIVVDPNSVAATKVANVNHVHPPETTDANGNQAVYLPLQAGIDPPTVAIDHPNKFLDVLKNYFGDAADKPFPFIDRTTLTAVTAYYRGTPDPVVELGVSKTVFVNASIYFIQPSHRTDALMIRCVWDIDLIRVDASEGVFASVRRYYGESLTHFFHVFYQDPKYDGATPLQPADFGPIMACFERQARLAVTEGVKKDAFKKADNRPFYLLWWPSPSLTTLRGNPLPGTLLNTDPRYYYSQHEQQTNLMFTIPMFPAL